jgi:glucokinase
VAAAGVAIGGPLDSSKGIIYSPPNLPGWDGVALRQQLQEALGLPVVVEHDAAACALAEYLWGAGRGADSLVYLTCGTGFGAGFVFHGRIHRGVEGRPGDIGHIRYQDDGPVAYGRAGSIEAYAAGSALTGLAVWKFPDRFAADPPTGGQVSALAAAGDVDAKWIVDTNADAVGDACAWIADLLYPDRILLGSLARYLGEPWLERVRTRFTAEAYPDAARLVQVLPATLGDRLQDCAALAAAMSRKQDRPLQ